MARPSKATRAADPHRRAATRVSVRAVQIAFSASRRSPDLGVRMNTPSLRKSPCTHARATVHDTDSQFANARTARRTPIPVRSLRAHKARTRPVAMRAAGRSTEAPMRGRMARFPVVRSTAADASRTAVNPKYTRSFSHWIPPSR